jgi:hypothetical protein
MNHMKNIYTIKSQKYFINEKVQSSYVQCTFEEIKNQHYKKSWFIWLENTTKN